MTPSVKLDVSANRFSYFKSISTGAQHIHCDVNCDAAVRIFAMTLNDLYALHLTPNRRSVVFIRFCSTEMVCIEQEYVDFEN